MNNKSDSEKESTKTASTQISDCCQGGYGYMKRRLGLLSNEADKLKEKGLKPDSKRH